MKTTGELKRPYEVIVLMHPDASLEEQKELFKKNKGIISETGGSIYSLDLWGKRNLATPIEKLKKAYFFHSTFEAGPKAIAELERTMNINDKVLRFMHTRLDERVPLSKYMEAFKQSLADTMTREKEREAKIQARKAAMASGEGPSRRSRDS